MTAQTILTVPDDRLKQQSAEVITVDARLQQRIDDLEDTRQAGPAAVGIAAPQTGWFERVVIVDVSGRKKTPSHGYLILINPEITEWSGYKLGREGCLSVPDFTGNVIRAEEIQLRAMNRDGEWQEYEMTGYEARAVQHEIDHLDGILFTDRVVSRRTDLFRRKVYQSGKG